MWQDKVKEIIDMPVMAEGKKNIRQVNGTQIYNEILTINSTIRIDKNENYPRQKQTKVFF